MPGSPAVKALLAVLATTAVMAPGARGADTLLAAGTGVANLTAYAGVAAWAHSTPAGFAIAVRRNGRVRDLALPAWPASDVPDPDLGPGRSGGAILVAARCARACVVYKVDLRSGAVTRLTGFGGLHCRRGIRSPATWRGRLVFIGEFCGGLPRHDTLYVRDPGGRIRRLRTVHSGDLGHTDLRGSLAAVNEPFRGPQAVRLVSIEDRRTRIVTEGEEGASFSQVPTSASFDGSNLYWLDSFGTAGRSKQWLAGTRASLRPTGRCEYRSFIDPPETPSRWAGSIAVDGGRVLYTVADEGVFEDSDRPAGEPSCASALSSGVVLRRW